MIRLEIRSDPGERATVVLHGQDAETCTRLVESFRRLAADRESVAVQSISGVEATNGVELLAVNEDGRAGVRAREGRLVWTQDSEGWLQVADLLDPFTHDAELGRFQHLEDDGDATIVYSTDGQW